MLTAALRRVLAPPDAVVARIRWERIGGDRGFTGLVARFHLEYSPGGAGPPTLIAKFPLAVVAESAYRRAQQQGPKAPRQPVERALREVWFYDVIAASLPLRVPRCWATASDPDRQRVVLLMEDITGARSGDALRGCSPDDAHAVLGEIALMHASWWRRAGSLAALPAWTGDSAARQRRQARYREHWNSLCARDDLDLPPRVRILATALCHRLAGILDELGAAEQTLIHADLHLDNVLFTPAGERPAVLLDWQSPCRGPAVLDGAHFLVASLSVRDRRAHERRILDAYWQKLRPVVDEDRVRFEADYALALIVRFAGVVGWLATAGSSAPTGREADLLAAALGDGRLVTALIDRDCDVLVQQR